MTHLDETIQDWLDGSEEAARTVLASTHPGITEAVRQHAEMTLRHLETIRATLPKAERYDEIRVSNAENARSPTKKLNTQRRNIEMAREFRRRELNRVATGGRASDLALMMEVGRLPKFNLRRSAAHRAITDGLARLNSSTERPKLD